MAVRASISLGLDFSPGQAFAREVWRSFRQKVHPFPGSGHFTMVVSFGRSSFWLDEESVALALEAAIGGFYGDLKVSVLRDRVFSFTVSSMKHRDIRKCRILVYATFPSPAQVPRDVVFRQPKVARFSGLRHPWTAPVYILSVEHAGVHPADEDPMPLVGNPHPLPGNLQPDNLNFVQPEYPEVGWNVPPVDAMPDFIPPVVNQPAPHEPDGVWEQHVQGSDANSAVSSASVSDVPPVVQVMAAEPLGLHAVHVVHVQDGAAHGGPVLDEVLGDHILVANVAEEDLGAVPVAEGFGDQVMVENAAEEENAVDPVAAAPVVQVLMEEEEVLPPIVADAVDMDVVVHAGPDDVLLPIVANENVGPAVDNALDDVVSPVVATENFTGFSTDHSEDTVADHVDVPSPSLAVVPFVPKRS
ncbi:hypothetical protein ACQ4PT_056693 [Festuca glaucescens]